jgi:hypothetical protein
LLGIVVEGFVVAGSFHRFGLLCCKRAEQVFDGSSQDVVLVSE